MTPARTIAACLTLAALGVCGCPQPPPQPPRNLSEFEKLRKETPEAYPSYVILQFNIQRVMDSRLSEEERTASLKLAAQLGVENPDSLSELATVLGQEDAPDSVKRGVLEILLRKDYPGLAGAVVAALPAVKSGTGLREGILDWLSRHGGPEVLAEVVKLWAQETSVTGPNEARFRQIVERVSGKPWDEALLGGLNSPGFFARGSALDLLAKRMPAAQLRRRIQSAAAETDAMASIQAMIERFDYLPLSGTELLACVSVYMTQRDMLPDAMNLFRKWQTDYGYVFNIRDFHLVSHLARDPLREPLGRTHLRMELAEALARREHVSTAAGDGNFSRQVEDLTMGDLWTLYLLNDMLIRPRVQIALRIMADRDRADTARAWGGLVFYENGRAEAKLYPAAPQASNDRLYEPSDRAVRDGRDALCFFHAHFEKVYNADRAGPVDRELADAAAGNYCGLVVTSLSESSFCAHYYTPQGRVISLGKLPFQK